MSSRPAFLRRPCLTHRTVAAEAEVVDAADVAELFFLEETEDALVDDFVVLGSPAVSLVCVFADVVGVVSGVAVVFVAVVDEAVVDIAVASYLV